jgi:hypothetical protein
MSELYRVELWGAVFNLGFGWPILLKQVFMPMSRIPTKIDIVVPWRLDYIKVNKEAYISVIVDGKEYFAGSGGVFRDEKAPGVPLAASKFVSIILTPIRGEL